MTKDEAGRIVRWMEDSTFRDVVHPLLVEREDSLFETMLAIPEKRDVVTGRILELRRFVSLHDEALAEIRNENNFADSHI